MIFSFCLDHKMNPDLEQSYRLEKERIKELISSIKLKEVPVFHKNEKKWLASVEIALLTLIETYSFGNWDPIAKLLSEVFEKEFTPKEVRDHYISTYCEGDIAEAMNVSMSGIYKCSLTDHTTKEDDELLEKADMYTYENVPSDFLEEVQYNPLREEYKEEYLPDAEELINFRNLSGTEEYDKNCRLICLDAYREKLADRAAMKEFIKKEKLVDKFFLKEYLESVQVTLPQVTVPPKKKPSQKGPIKKKQVLQKAVTVGRQLQSSAEQPSTSAQALQGDASSASVTNRRPRDNLKRKCTMNKPPEKKSPSPAQRLRPRRSGQ